MCTNVFLHFFMHWLVCFWKIGWWKYSSLESGDVEFNKQTRWRLEWGRERVHTCFTKFCQTNKPKKDFLSHLGLYCPPTWPKRLGTSMKEWTVFEIRISLNDRHRVCTIVPRQGTSTRWMLKQYWKLGQGLSLCLIMACLHTFINHHQYSKNICIFDSYFCL